MSRFTTVIIVNIIYVFEKKVTVIAEKEIFFFNVVNAVSKTLSSNPRH